VAEEALRVWLETPFEGGPPCRAVAQLEETITSADERTCAKRCGSRRARAARTSPNPLRRAASSCATGASWRRAGTEGRAASRRGAALRKLEWRAPRATVYVNLDRTVFHGAPPPCTDRLIESKGRAASSSA